MSEEKFPVPLEDLMKDENLRADWSPDEMLYEYQGKLWLVTYGPRPVESVTEYKGEVP